MLNDKSAPTSRRPRGPTGRALEEAILEEMMIL